MRTRTESGEVLLGREHPSGVVRAEINRLVDSHGGVLLIAGEAGIGKTTLAADAAEHARNRGVLVLGGSCWDSASAPGYWPWVQVIRALRRGTSADEWHDITAATGQSLGILLGEVAGAAPLLPASGDSPFSGPAATASTDRFQLADAVTTALVMASQLRPVMVVLDDLHWADPASIQLLEFAAQHTWFERLLLVGTYRDAEVDALDGAVRSLLAPIVAKANTVTLTGLSQDEVAALIARVSGRDPDQAIVAEVHRRTGGNPFFVEQTARLWQVGGPIGAVPPGVRDAVRRRVAMLPDRLVEQLTAASVLGQEFDPGLLAGITATDDATVDDLLAVANTARLVVPAAEGRYRFVHDLVRETLYGGLSEEGRRRRHATVVTVAQCGPDLRDRLLPADLARHARLAGDVLEPDVTARLLLAAATDAESRLAMQEAHDHFRHALERARDPVLRGRIAIDFSHVLLHASQPEMAERYLNEATTTALATNDAELMVRAALAGRRMAQIKPERTTKAFDGTALIREVHARLIGTETSTLSEDEMVRDLIARTEQIARQEGNDDALSFSLWARHEAIWGLGTATERLAVTAEMISVGRRTGDADSELFATSLNWVARLELGDPGYLDQLEAFVAASERLDAPRFRVGAEVDRSIIAAFRGDFSAAEKLLADLTEHGDHGAQDFLHLQHHLLWALAMLRGDFDGAERVLAEVPDGGLNYIDLVSSITAVERAYAEQGWPGSPLPSESAEMASGVPTRLAGPGVMRAQQHVRDVRNAKPYPRYVQPLWLRLQTGVAVATGDLDLLNDVRGALEPHRGEWLVSIFGCDISGPADHWLALLELRSGRVDDATTSATAAVDAAVRLGSRPWRLAAQAALARAWAARGDHDQASELAARVEREAAAIGMRQLRGILRSAAGSPAIDPSAAPQSGGVTTAAPPSAGVATAAPPSTGAVDAPASTGAVPEFRRNGAVWRLGFAGHLAHVPDSKGLRDLHTLLSRPGTDIAAVALFNPAAGPEVVTALSYGGDPVLDEEATAQYRARLATLDTELDRSDERGDAGRAAELARERDALLAELRHAIGLGGRARRLGDEGERARKAVTNRIRDTLRKLDRLHPPLAAHLRGAVSTGAACRYAPAETVNWQL